MLSTDPRNWVGFDVESSGELPEYGLQPWSGSSWLTSFATARIDRRDTQMRIKTEVWPSSLSRCRQLLRTDLKSNARSFAESCIANQRVVVGWNVAFDAAWLIKLGLREQVMRLKWFDAMLAWKHITRTPEWGIDRHKKKKYGLKEAVAEFLPNYVGYDAGINFHDTSPKMVKARLKYNRADAAFTLNLAHKFMLMLKEPGREKQLRSLVLECRSIPLIADHYMTGLHVDEEEAVALGERINAQRNELLRVLDVNHHVSEMTLNSPAQLATLLYEDWQLPVKATTPKGKPSTNKEALYELSFLDERADMIKRVRELRGNKTKFVDNVLESCRYNGGSVSHPTAIINGTYTGRMTFASSIGKGVEKRQTGFALHQMKRDSDYRRPICAPPGWTMVEWDAAGQEYRWVAIESGDPTMLSLCEIGQDPHSYMAAEMTDLTYQQMREAYKTGQAGAYETRMAGKVGNLSCQYRIGPKSLLRTARVQYHLPWDINMAQHVHSAYHDTYVGVKKYWRRKIMEAQRKGYAETIAGRRVILEGDWFGDTQWQLESTAINFPIQGVGADQKYLAMAAVKPLLTKYGGKFYFELHDGLYAIFPDRVAEKAAYEGRELLSNLPYRRAWGFTPPIPLPWDMKIGKNWGDLEERE